MKIPISRLLLLLLACATPALHADSVPNHGYEVVRTYPHDALAFTQGLFFLNGFLYESTGLEGRSSVRKVRLEDGNVMQKQDLPRQFFGEGIVGWKDRLIGLTYRSETGFVYDLATFKPLRQFKYRGEGWGLTHDGRRLIMSDGTSELRFWDPETLSELGRVKVTDQGRPVESLNELEWVKGEIFANVWQTDRIARIDPVSGKVLGWIDLTGLLKPADRIAGYTDVLNGIAYDAASGRLFVTGKRWPKLFEIRVVEKK